MNIKSTSQLFRENGIVSLKADKDKMPGVNELLVEYGNTAKAIPYYAIYSPGWDEPKHFGGTVLTPGSVKELIEEALSAAKNADGEKADE